MCAVSGNNNFWTKGSESFMPFSLLGAKVPENESSTYGTFAPGSVLTTAIAAMGRK